MSLKSAQTILEEEVRLLYNVPEEAALDQIAEPRRTYVQYALETVHRGRIVLDELRPYRSLDKIRFLDAGCAYGGFLAAAVESGAREVVGVDVDDRFLKIARRFLPEFGIPYRIEKGDASDPEFLAPFGRFDLITCNDVIEHVDSVPRLVESLAGALEGGGCLYVAAPNRMCPEFIRKDPHFQFFGIVLLERLSAERYAVTKTGWPHYDVGHYLELPDHRALFESQGVTFEVINPPAGDPGAIVERLSAEYREVRAMGEAFEDPKLPPDLVEETRRAVAAAADTFERRVAAGDPPAEIALDYAVPVWHFLARRPGVESGTGGGLGAKLKTAWRRLRA